MARSGRAAVHSDCAEIVDRGAQQEKQQYVFRDLKVLRHAVGGSMLSKSAAVAAEGVNPMTS